MYEILKQISLERGWKFVYGRRDYANLQAETPQGQILCILDSIEVSHNMDRSTGHIVSANHFGFFKLLVNAKTDETYEDKYVNYIQPMHQEALVILNQITCNYTLNNDNIKEEITQTDYNMDGIRVNYSITVKLNN